MGLQPNPTQHIVNKQEHEETLLALVQLRTREVKNLRYYISYYTTQLEEAERNLQECKSKLATLRGETSPSSPHINSKEVKIEYESKNGSFHDSDGSPENHHVGSKVSHLAQLSPFAMSTIISDKSQRVSVEQEAERNLRGCKSKLFSLRDETIPSSSHINTRLVKIECESKNGSFHDRDGSPKNHHVVSKISHLAQLSPSPFAMSTIMSDKSQRVSFAMSTIMSDKSQRVSIEQEAEKTLRECESKLATLRGETSPSSSHINSKQVKIEYESKNGSFHERDGSHKKHHVGSNISHLVKLSHSPFAMSKIKSDKSQRVSVEQEAERNLRECKSKLAILRDETSPSSSHINSRRVKIECESKNGSFHDRDCSLKNHHVSSKISHLVKLSPPFAMSTIMYDKSQRVPIPIKQEVKVKDKGSKRKFEQKEDVRLISLICKSYSPESVLHQRSNHFSSQHKRRVRCVAVNPANDYHFVTSALDGVVNLWEVHSSESRASLLRTTNCISPKLRWPEDVVWHPEGNRLLSVYSADGQDSQISVTDFSRVKSEGRAYVNFLEEKPHVKGVINNIAFLPWENTSFVTGGTDHTVVMWRENGQNKWKPQVLHQYLHSSAVMGVSGMQQRQIVLSVGKDKRILGYDAHVGRQDFMQQVDSKCLSVLPNPRDVNLFMVQTGTPERQLRLFDIRSRRPELHAFGWKQESSESQSALINQDWSPNGLYITSGSADPMIHIFDIRYNGHKPSQSIVAHQKRVFRAMWLRSVPFLISISSDLNIGLHKIL